MAGAEDPTAAVEAVFAAAEAVDSALAGDFAEDRVHLAEEDLRAGAGSAGGRADLAADGHSAVAEDFVVVRNAADLRSGALAGRIADLADARVWDADWEARGALRALRGRLPMGDGMDSEIAGGWQVECGPVVSEMARLPMGDGIRLDEAAASADGGLGISPCLTPAATDLQAMDSASGAVDSGSIASGLTVSGSIGSDSTGSVSGLAGRSLASALAGAGGQDGDVDGAGRIGTGAGDARAIGDLDGIIRPGSPIGTGTVRMGMTMRGSGTITTREITATTRAMGMPIIPTIRLIPVHRMMTSRLRRTQRRRSQARPIRWTRSPFRRWFI